VRDFGPAEYIIKKHEGFNAKAYADPLADGCWTIGYGSQFYIDGSPVQKGHRITRTKAQECLSEELLLISEDIDGLNLSLTASMKQALISFIHSVGWQAFLYSNIVDAIEVNDVTTATQEINQWIFDEEHKAVGGLVERRMEETALFLSEEEGVQRSANILLKAFRDYEASAEQVAAIRKLESSISPYILADFANHFDLFNRHSVFLDYDPYEIYKLSG
jgi:GH24 family phage-related lysozyme (muramidase)|tara:strand:- start:439 stop:1095 length:657 start_codon:yes stop_codon:yes gene_type:complete